MSTLIEFDHTVLTFFSLLDLSLSIFQKKRDKNVGRTRLYGPLPRKID